MKRMQVVMEEAELRRLHEVARAQGQSLSEWVRESLRRASRETVSADIEVKLAALRTAIRHGADRGESEDEVEVMNAQIAGGYLSGRDDCP